MHACDPCTQYKQHEHMNNLLIKTMGWPMINNPQLLLTS